MPSYHAIIIAGALMISTAGAIMVLDRYEVARPFSSMMFNRFDLWTGRVETCSSFYDNKIYCGSDLVQIAQEALDTAHLAANNRFLSLGYSQEDIDHWPTPVLETARSLVGNGSSNERLEEFLSGCAANGENNDVPPCCQLTGDNEHSCRPSRAAPGRLAAGRLSQRTGRRGRLMASSL
jgi:hypothetical protein